MNSKNRKQQFKQTMAETQKSLGPISKLNSKIAHFRPIEAVGDFLASTLFRPYMVIGAAIGAILTMTFAISLDKMAGYGMSGSEVIIGALIGWLIGGWIDFFGKSVSGN